MDSEGNSLTLASYQLKRAISRTMFAPAECFLQTDVYGIHTRSNGAIVEVRRWAHNDRINRADEFDAGFRR